MINQNQKRKIKEAVEEFFSKMTVPVVKMDVNVFTDSAEKDVVDLNIQIEEPQILIGQGGQTLFEIQRLLRMMLNNKMESIFYLNLDINDYKNKKENYLKNLAKELADEVALRKEEKNLLPMPSYERRIIHAELSKRPDVSTESLGNGLDRHIVIKPN